MESAASVTNPAPQKLMKHGNEEGIEGSERLHDKADIIYKL